jgi:predicted DNA-binding transcriptional regulator AlpA
MSKIQSAEYLGVSRATFDNLVKDGFIPKGMKQDGFKELSWSKIDLDLYLHNTK